MADARSASKANLLADVKADTSYTNVFFGFYQRQCTTVTGRVANVASAVPAAVTTPSQGAP